MPGFPARDRAGLRAPLSVVLVALFSGCGEPPPAAEPRDRPAERIVSLDYCADQYVLGLVERDRIVALSPDSQASYSYLREDARGLPQVRAVAEEVLALRPDLIVRSYGGGPQAAHFFRRAGVPVAQLEFAADFDGIRRVIRDLASALGVLEQGEDLIAEMDARLAVVAAGREGGPAPDAFYITPGGATGGSGTMVDELFAAAGLRNFQTAPGYRSIPLERLAYGWPDLMAPAFYETERTMITPWSSSRHSVARRALAELPGVALDGAWIACRGWFLLDAVEALAHARRGLEAPAGSP